MLAGFLVCACMLGMRVCMRACARACVWLGSDPRFHDHENGFCEVFVAVPPSMTMTALHAFAAALAFANLQI